MRADIPVAQLMPTMLAAWSQGYTTFSSSLTLPAQYYKTFNGYNL
jgi:hypothetical protein